MSELKRRCLTLETKLASKEKESEKSKSEANTIAAANHKLIVESEVNLSF
jgi:hypothetical protein